MTANSLRPTDCNSSQPLDGSWDNFKVGQAFEPDFAGSCQPRKADLLRDDPSTLDVARLRAVSRRHEIPAAAQRRAIPAGNPLQYGQRRPDVRGRRRKAVAGSPAWLSH